MAARKSSGVGHTLLTTCTKWSGCGNDEPTRFFFFPLLRFYIYKKTGRKKEKETNVSAVAPFRFLLLLFRPCIRGTMQPMGNEGCIPALHTI